MKKRNQRLVLGLVVLAVIIGSFALYLAWPLLTGTDIVLKTRPVDPFDPLRGQYMVINYDINTVPSLAGAEPGQTVYVSVVQEGDVWVYSSVSSTKPATGIALRGTVDYNYGDTMRVRYGIEQFFFERNADVPTRDITVHVKVSSNGGSRLVELLQNNEPVNITYRPVKLTS